MRVKLVILIVASILILGTSGIQDVIAPPPKVVFCHAPGTIDEETLELPLAGWLNGHKDQGHGDGDFLGECETNSLHISKFYDVNVNGEKDVEEPFIANWLVEVAEFEGETDVITTSSTTLTTAWFDDIEGDVLVSEAQEDNWVPTNQEVPPILITVFDSDATVTVASNTRVTIDGETIVLFGNVCLGEGGGHSKGFWGNKHGQALIDQDDLDALNDDHPLVNDDGIYLSVIDVDFFDSPSDVKNWLKEARAKNMAYMLSAQLATMQLNVNHGVDDQAFVYAPGIVDGENFLTIQKLMDEADIALDANPDTTSPSDDRDHQEAIKDALDDANNDLIFVQPEICDPFEEEILLP